MTKKKKKSPGKFKTVKARVELEQKFLGRLINETGGGDVRDVVARLGISWRNFRDKRHRAIWRALETLNTLGIEERMDILVNEAYAEAEAAMKADPRVSEPVEDAVWGQPGSEWNKKFKQKLQEDSMNGLLWLERELEADGVLAVVGGKMYLRELEEIGKMWLLSPEHTAEELWGRNVC